MTPKFILNPAKLKTFSVLLQVQFVAYFYGTEYPIRSTVNSPCSPTARSRKTSTIISTSVAARKTTYSAIA